MQARYQLGVYTEHKLLSSKQYFCKKVSLLPGRFARFQKILFVLGLPLLNVTAIYMPLKFGNGALPWCSA